VCNSSKGNKITCPKCAHWMSPDLSACEICKARLTYSKRTHKYRYGIENVYLRVGRLVVLGASAVVLLFLLTCGIVVVRHFHTTRSKSDATNVNLVVNDFVTTKRSQPATFKLTVPDGALNARVVGLYKVVSGSSVVCISRANLSMALVTATPERICYETERANQPRYVGL
jgi:hypothetical protein